MREEYASCSFLAVTVAGIMLLCCGLLAVAFKSDLLAFAVN